MLIKKPLLKRTNGSNTKDRYYDPADWAKLTLEQREEIKKLRKQQKENKRNNVSSLMQHKNKDTPDDQSDSNAGDQFALPNKRVKFN